ncbi:DUF1206 domain-containing protein [Bacillus sp. ISL-55]|uniref:DUF1206 domain-containing protein n=1 Tax=Bacillus sp. ISL-55 TaxID=2819134 RepID=UPI001BE54138|nr:DUF1206 domain-containing protein [Bacillus sp. ISL-55]MBT2691697.1 DUF1206 domain-containing protein [Bacillus sp. ISL-55]
MSSPSTIEVRNKLKEVKPWMRRFARFGYIAKGIVFGMVGVLAALAAFGPKGETTGTSGALQSISEMPLGEVALWIIGFGLIGYILWDFIKAIKDPENEGKDAKGLIKRTGYFISGLIYSNLAFGAIKLASNTGSAGGDNSEKTISAKLMEQPFGVWLVGLVGAVIIGYGVYELYSGAKEKFMTKFKTYEMNDKERKIARLSGKIGLISRGIVLSMVGFFFIRTAYTHNPNESKGLGGALTELASQPFGQFLLAIVAAGLILYGIYQIIKGRYQHMNFGYDGK